MADLTPEEWAAPEFNWPPEWVQKEIDAAFRRGKEEMRAEAAKVARLAWHEGLTNLDIANAIESLPVEEPKP